MITDATEHLKRLYLGKQDTVMVDLLSNTAFMGTDATGLPSEAINAKAGRYHITGSLTVAPTTLMKKILLDCLPIAVALKGTGTMLLSPVPRYVYDKCCTD
jgi:hypothetical protein